MFVIEKILLNVEAIERQEEQCNEMVPHILRNKRNIWGYERYLQFECHLSPSSLDCSMNVLLGLAVKL